MPLISEVSGLQGLPGKSDFKSSKALIKDRLRYFIVGSPGAGKTTMAMTISERDDLSDIILIAGDTNAASVVIADRGVDIENTLDLDEIAFNRKIPFSEACVHAARLAVAKVESDPSTPWKIVVDTATAVCNRLANQTFETVSLDDMQRIWGTMSRLNGAFFYEINRVRAPLVWTGHSSMASDFRDGAELRLEIQGATREETIKADLIGKTLKLYVAQTDVFGYLRKTEGINGVERWFYPDGGDRAQGKNRFEKHLGTKIAPDMQKIQGILRPLFA